MPLNSTLRKIYDRAASTECAVALFIAIALVAIPGTFTESRAIYGSPFFLALLAAFALNLTLCTVRRWKQLSAGVLVLHCGVLATLAGCILTSFGYVATVNVYEGTTVDQVYNWDLQRDVNFGASLGVRKINFEYWPVPVKVGVLRGQEKEELYVTKTGESFIHRGYRIQVEGLEPSGDSLTLAVYQQDRKIGSCTTAGYRDLPADFPYSFVLVAYQTPHLKRQWVDLAVLRDGREAATGTAEVNSPFRWEGLYLYNTQVGRDQGGNYFAGIQIVRDPGRPLVFAGFLVMGAGAVMTGIRRMKKRRTAADA